MVLDNPAKATWHEGKKRQEAEFEHVRRAYSFRKPVVVQCRVQRSRVLERNVVGILPVTGKSLQDCLCLQSVPKECVRYRWSVLFQMKFDLSAIPEEVLMPSSPAAVGEKFQFVYADSRKNGRIVGTSEPFSFGLEDDFTEFGLSKLKKGKALNAPYFQLQLNSNCSNNNAGGPEDNDDDDDKEMDIDGPGGSDKEGEDDGNIMMLPIDEEEEEDLAAAAVPYVEDTAAAVPEAEGVLKSAPSTEDEYVFVVGADDPSLGSQLLSDVSQESEQNDSTGNDTKIDGKMGLSNFNGPHFDWADSTGKALVKEIEAENASSSNTPVEIVELSSSSDINEEVQDEPTDVVQSSATPSDLEQLSESVIRSPYQQTKESADDLAETHKTSASLQSVDGSIDGEDVAPMAVTTVEPEKTSSSTSADHIEIVGDAADTKSSSTNEVDVNGAVQDIGIGTANNDQTTQYVQYTTADGEVCWGVAASATVPVVPTNQQLAIDMYTISERLCALETQWGQWIPYLNSRIDHLTNSHQLLFDDCNVQKANISDLSERMQTANGTPQRDNWGPSRQQDRRYGNYRNRNTERERRYNEESNEVVGYYEYYNSQFNNRFGGRGRGNYRRDNGYNRQDGQRRGYYQQNRRYEVDRNQENGQKSDENHSGEDERTDREHLQFEVDVHAQQTKTRDQPDDLDLKEEKVVIAPQKS